MTTLSRAARDAIQDLTADNLWALDTHDIDRYVATYWDDGVWTDFHPDGSVSRLEGADAIREGTSAYFAARGGHQHRMENAVYAPSENGWTATYYYWSTVRDAESGAIELQTTGWISDELEERGGQWRIRSRTVSQWDGTRSHPLAGA